MSEFKWTDGLVREFEIYTKKFSFPLSEHLMNEWKQSKEVNPEYEILSFKSNLGYICELRDGLYKYKTHGGWTLDVMLSPFSTSMAIHSVRRNSDNSVWTVGDNTNHGTITGFDILGGSRMHVYTLPQNITELKDISKAPSRTPEPEKVFSEEQYKQIWNMIFSQTGYPEGHEKHVKKL